MTRATRLRTLADAMSASGEFEDEAGKVRIACIRNAADWIDPVAAKHWPVTEDVSECYWSQGSERPNAVKENFPCR